MNFATNENSNYEPVNWTWMLGAFWILALLPAVGMSYVSIFISDNPNPNFLDWVAFTIFFTTPISVLIGAVFGIGSTFGKRTRRKDFYGQLFVCLPFIHWALIIIIFWLNS